MKNRFHVSRLVRPLSQSNEATDMKGRAAWFGRLGIGYDRDRIVLRRRERSRFPAGTKRFPSPQPSARARPVRSMGRRGEMVAGLGGVAWAKAGGRVRSRSHRKMRVRGKNSNKLVMVDG